MKKIFTILIALLAVVGAKANILSSEGLEYSSLGTEISSLDNLTEGYYILQCNGSYYLYQNQSDGKIYQINSSNNLSDIYVVKISISATATNSKDVTIQACNGNYYYGTPGNQISTGTEATTFTVTSTGTNLFFFKNSNGYPMNGNTNNKSYTQIANDATWLGGWSQFKIYPVNTQTATETTFTVNTYYAPTGTTYKIGDTDLEITETDGLGTGTFAAIAGNVTDSYVTVTPPTGYSSIATVSGTTYTINFAPTVIGKTKYYSTNKPATEITEGQWYLISQTRDGLGFAKNNSGTYYKYAASNFTNGSAITSDNYTYLFQFVSTGNENEYYIMGADGKYFGALTGNVAVTASDTREAYTIKKVELTDGTTSTYYFSIQNASSSVVVDNNGNGYTVAGWNTALPTSETGNSAWRFFPVSDTQITHTVNWNISYTDGSETKTKTVTQSVIDGEDATLPSYAYTTVNTTDMYTNITDDKEISATATFSNLPFTSSTDYENAKWYYFKAIRTTGNNAGTYYAYYDASATTENIKINKNSNSNTKNYKWAFIGNPIEGYMVINKNGENLYAYAANGANNTMLSVNSTETTWNIVNASAQAENSFCFYLKGTTGGYWNCYNSSSKIGMWQEGSTDEGSRWFVEEAPENDEADIAAYTAALDKANAYIFGTGLSEYSGDGSAIVSARTNYSGLTVNNTQEEVDDATAAINEAITNSISNLTLNMPTRNSSFVKIKSYASGRNVAPGTSSTSGTSTTVAGTTAITTIETAATDGSDIWFYGTDGLISYTAGTYLANRGATIEAQTAEISANTNYIGTYFVQTAGIYDFNKSGNGQYPGLDRGNSQSSDEGYAWKLEAVTSLPVTAHQSGDGKYYATACVPVAVTVDGATAYKVTTANNNDTIAGVAVLEEIGTTVPANTPMLLIGSQENVTLNITESDATAPTDNILSGASTATEVVDGNYYFGQNDNVPGFYKVNYDNTGSTRIYITNRAYLTTVGDATTSQAKGFTFVFGDDDPTGIGSATASDEILQNSVRYNLQGQRVDESYKGIVIIGGKKYLIK